MSADGIGTYQEGEIVYQGYSVSMAQATAKVVHWFNNTLHLTNINGNFVSDQPIVGAVSKSNYTFTSYVPVSQKFVEINQFVDPINANVGDPWTANTIIREFPEVFTPIEPISYQEIIIDLETSLNYRDLQY